MIIKLGSDIAEILAAECALKKSESLLRAAELKVSVSEKGEATAEVGVIDVRMTEPTEEEKREEKKLELKMLMKSDPELVEEVRREIE